MTSGSGTATSNRVRLIEGFAAAIEEKGLAATTIADIARHARLSKRTFYEEFANKEEVFVALYSATMEEVLAEVQQIMAEREGDWPVLVRDATLTFFNRLRERPALTRAHFLEIYSLGEVGLRIRREALSRWIATLQDVLARGTGHGAPPRPLTVELITAYVGGINELALQAIEEDRATHLDELGDAVVEFGLRLIAPETLGQP